ncbi:hypothetical protein K1T73_00190 [Roseovarius sp. SCSIO 43702]|uniref:nidogen-like domain-containing protein n=1 Tax=Roseovarius sp. SCSIO 43702 TaxID=2823043 RepID=UPI001C72B1AB|nr:nidogen-like domain-containing protein [Roseovarius sp. SCSIO 43702]QYX56876.1 hypothetical protein K1T73_00190 [Roseovarius sp. SCSIO 43702]
MPVTGQVVRGLGGAKGVGETPLPRSDDGSVRLDARDIFESGLSIFGTSYAGDAIYVNTNGAISFGAPLPGFPQDGAEPISGNILAPFWADIDTRIDGEGTESGQIWIDRDLATDTLTITWEDVGAYRRQADLTNLFQVQLIDRGSGDLDIIFRYERIEWTQGTAEGDAGAAAFLSGPRVPEALVLAADPAALHTTIGNTGEVGVWHFEMRQGAVDGAIPVNGLVLTGDAGANVLDGGAADDLLRGRPGPDVLRGFDGDDWLFGDDGADTLNGGAGDDVIIGGTSDADLRDVIYAGDGNDRVEGGHGNDLVYGGEGNDSIEGGFGVDELIGQGGNDVITGSALSDLIYGGDGSDFLNGGFGFDRLNGGAGADRFYHLGIPDHGSDWVQDYDAAEGDLLFWGGGPVSASDFQVNWADTANAGKDGVSEAFVIHRPSGHIIWALVDAADQPEINLRTPAGIYDLLA